MRRLIWSSRARQDLIDIASYYDEIDPALADKIIDRIEGAPLPLLHAPFIGSLAPDGARKWRARRTPVLLRYDVGEETIEIVAVRHVRSGWGS